MFKKSAVVLIEIKARVTQDESDDLCGVIREFFAERQDNPEVVELSASGRYWIDERKQKPIYIDVADEEVVTALNASKQAVITLLTDHGAPMLRRDIIKGCKGFGFATVVRAVDELTRSGKVVRAMCGKQAQFAIPQPSQAWWNDAEAEASADKVEEQ